MGEIMETRKSQWLDTSKNDSIDMPTNVMYKEDNSNTAVIGLLIIVALIVILISSSSSSGGAIFALKS